MTEQELERALRKALPPLHPEPSLTERIVAQINSPPGKRTDPDTAAGGATAVSVTARPASAARRWLPAAIAATALLAIGFTQWAQQQHQRQLQVRAQLLQGLTIASASLRDVRSMVLRNEDSAP
jgi:hypothetical protein